MEKIGGKVWWEKFSGKSSVRKFGGKVWWEGKFGAIENSVRGKLWWQSSVVTHQTFPPNLTKLNQRAVKIHFSSVGGKDRCDGKFVAMENSVRGEVWWEGKFGGRKSLVRGKVRWEGKFSERESSVRWKIWCEGKFSAMGNSVRGKVLCEGKFGENVRWESSVGKFGGRESSVLSKIRCEGKFGGRESSVANFGCLTTKLSHRTFPPNFPKLNQRTVKIRFGSVRVKIWC